MKTYKIFVSPLGQTEAVKKGWSWPGFFFTIFWFLAKKMWRDAALLWGLLFLWVFFLEGSVVVEDSPLYRAVNMAWGIGLPFGTGMSGNRWREKHLLRRGYEHQETPKPGWRRRGRPGRRRPTRR